MRVYSRAGCHLCTDAEDTAAHVCADLGIAWERVDVDADPGLAAFFDHVPVTYVDGRRLAIWFLDADSLRAALAAG